jgi:Polyketide cyclase / dehydrase and lipid transport
MRRWSLSLLAAIIVAVWTTEAKPVGLTAEQSDRLDRGDVVFLDVLPPGDSGGGQGGTAIVRVHAAAESVWRVLVDYPQHRGLYPRVVEAEVLASETDHTLVRYVVGVGPFSFGFHVNNYPDPGRRRLEWRLAHERPNDLFRASWGYWEIVPRQNGVLLTYAMAARTVLPGFLMRGVERGGLVETLKAVRERVEHGD